MRLLIRQVKCGGIGQFLHRERTKLGLLLIDHGEIFLLQSSEFTKSLYFGSNSKKVLKKLIFLPINLYLFPFQSKVRMKIRPKITEISTMPKSTKLPRSVSMVQF